MDRIWKVRQRLQTRMNPRFLARATGERKWKFAEIWKTTKGTSQGWSGGLSVEFGQLISTCLLDIHPREATE